MLSLPGGKENVNIAKVKRGANVNRSLIAFWLAAVIPYSSQVQQPMRATAVLSRHPHMHWTASFGREQGRAGSLHPDGAPLTLSPNSDPASLMARAGPLRDRARNARSEPPKRKGQNVQFAFNRVSTKRRPERRVRRAVVMSAMPLTPSDMAPARTNEIPTRNGRA